MIFSTGAFASLWENQNWALLGSMGVVTGYDSNLVLLHDSPGSGFVTASPSLTFERQNSDTDIVAVGGVSREQFFSGVEPSETDISFNATVDYPNTPNSIPIYKLNATWLRSSQPNQYLGERVQFNQETLSGEGYLTLTGKLGVRGTAEADSTTFDSSSLNNQSHGQVSAGLGYAPNQLSIFSINMSGALARSIPNDPARTFANIHSSEYDLTARVQGQITDKVSGSLYGGYGTIDYTGGYTNRSNIPVAGADLTWGIDPRRTVVLAGYSGAANVPDGTAVVTSRAFISFTDVVISGWQFTVGAGPTRSVFSQHTVFRRDSSWDFGAQLAYTPSTRFQVALGIHYTRNNSDIIEFQYDHEVVTLRATYSF